MTKYFELVKEKILKQLRSKEYIEAYQGTEQFKVDKNHSLQVVELITRLWKKDFHEEPPEALCIAGLVHDSDRYYPQREVNTKNVPPSLYEYRKGIHSGNTALIFFEHNYHDLPLELLRDVCFLVLRHERGGDVDKEGVLFEKKDEYTFTFNLNLLANYLYYADKLSFFYSNIFLYKERGAERLVKKIAYSITELPPHILDEIRAIPYDDPTIKEALQKVLSQVKQ